MTDTVRSTPGGKVVAGLRTAGRFEAAIWRSLVRWVRRRPATEEPGVHAFPYVGAVSMIFWVFIILSAVEIPALHFILPWPTVRYVFLAIGVYGLIWMIGLLATMHVHPHLVGPSGLRVRYGTTTDLTIAWDDIATVRARQRTLPPEGGRSRYETTDAGRIASISMNAQTGVDVVLRRPLPMDLPKNDGAPVIELRIWADDAAALVAHARRFLPEAAGAA